MLERPPSAPTELFKSNDDHNGLIRFVYSPLYSCAYVRIAGACQSQRPPVPTRHNFRVRPALFTRGRAPIEPNTHTHNRHLASQQSTQCHRVVTWTIRTRLGNMANCSTESPSRVLPIERDSRWTVPCTSVESVRSKSTRASCSSGGASEKERLWTHKKKWRCVYAADRARVFSTSFACFVFISMLCMSSVVCAYLCSAYTTRSRTSMRRAR